MCHSSFKDYMKLNDLARQKIEKRNLWQLVKHPKLSSGLLRDLKREPWQFWVYNRRALNLCVWGAFPREAWMNKQRVWRQRWQHCQWQCTPLCSLVSNWVSRLSSSSPFTIISLDSVLLMDTLYPSSSFLSSLVDGYPEEDSQARDIISGIPQGRFWNWNGSRRWC